MRIDRSETDVTDISVTPPKLIQFLIHKDSAQFTSLSFLTALRQWKLFDSLPMAYPLLRGTLVCASLRTRGGKRRRQATISSLVDEGHPTSSARTATWVCALLSVITDAGEKAEPPWKRRTVPVNACCQNPWSPGKRDERDEKENLPSCRV